MEIDRPILLVTLKQFEYGLNKMVKLTCSNMRCSYNQQREYFAKRGYDSFILKGFIVTYKRFKEYTYLDLRGLGNNFNKWIKFIHSQIGN